MVLLEGLGNAFVAIPNPVFAVIHLVTAIAGFYFAFKMKDNAMYLWGFVLYGLTGLMYTLVHFDLLHPYAVHVLESVLVFIAILMIGFGMSKK